MIGQQAARGRARFAFTDRHGGVSAPPFDELNVGGRVGDDPAAVRENRARVAGALDLDPTRVVWMRQVHGREVATVTASDEGPWQGETPEADALVTTTARLALAVLVADCTPVLLADPEAGVVAAAHAGRQGLAAGVVPATLARMRELGARPDRVVAYTGPAVCGRCYEVPRDLQQAVAAAVPGTDVTTRAGTPGLDIPGGVWSQLAAGGVREGQRSPVCSMESPAQYSYRRERRTGRFAGYTWLIGGPPSP